MIICHSKRFIFFSAPKAGSETLRTILSQWSEEPISTWQDRTDAHPFYAHMPPVEALEKFQERNWPFEDYIKITTVRNPFARLVSLYRMIDAVDGVWRIRRRAGLTNPDFATWLCQTRPYGFGGGGRPHQRWRRYGTWSAQTWCAGQMDHIIRLEKISDDLPKVLRILSIPHQSIPHINARPPLDLADWYTPDLIKLVEERYAWDLRMFGYHAPKLGVTA